MFKEIVLKKTPKNDNTSTRTMIYWKKNNKILLRESTVQKTK